MFLFKVSIYTTEKFIKNSFFFSHEKVDSFHGPSTVAKRAQRFREIFGSDSETEELDQYAKQQIIAELCLSESDNNNTSEDDVDVLELSTETDFDLPKTPCKIDHTTSLSHTPAKREREWERETLEITFVNDFDLEAAPKTPKIEIASFLKYPLHLSPIVFQKRDSISPKQNVSLLRYQLSSPSKATNIKESSVTVKTDREFGSHRMQNEEKEEKDQKSSHTKKKNDSFHFKHTNTTKASFEISCCQNSTTNNNSQRIIRTSPKPVCRTHTKQNHSLSYHRKASQHTHPFRRLKTHTKANHSSTHTNAGRSSTHTNASHSSTRTKVERESVATANPSAHTLTPQHPTSHTHTTEDLSGTRILTLNNKLVPQGVRFAIAVDANKTYTKNALKKITRNLLSQM